MLTGRGAGATWADRYPQLARPHLHSWAGVTRGYTLELTSELPPDDLVVNVRLLPTVAGRVVVCQTAEGWRTLPGGSRELGESVEETVRRELLEEAGCTTTSDSTWFASYTVTSRDGPWRDWHPFPVSAWLVGTVEVELVSQPTNPPDGEEVVAVHVLAPRDAQAYLSGFDNGGQAGLVALAVDLGVLATTASSGRSDDRAPGPGPAR